MADNRSKTIFVFTGQGAQYHGMAHLLYDTEPVFKNTMDELDAIAKNKTGSSVTGFLYGESGENSSQMAFDDITISHPALFMVQFSLAKTLIHCGVKPDLLLGTSLGEFVAMAVAKVMTPEDMLSAILEHALLVKASCPPGNMAGVWDRHQRYAIDEALYSKVSLAAVSSPKHFVLSGDLGPMQQVIAHLEKADTLVQPLPIKYGFHSPAIEPVQNPWKEKLKIIIQDAGGLNSPMIDMLSCCTGGFVRQPDIDFLVRIGRDPIFLPNTLEVLVRRLSEQSLPPFLNIIDLGPGSFTSGFIRQNKILKPPLNVFRVMTLFGNEIKNLEKIKTKVISS